MIRFANFIVIISLAVFSLLQVNDSSAQLSPGDLNEAHAQLEGLQNCEKCHEAGNQVASTKCLDCHKLMAKRISAGEGLHGRNSYDDCVACHVEHLGRDSELIIWLEEPADFDHSLAGYILEGKHAKLKCRQCHNAEKIKADKFPAEQYKDLNRTFIGLDRACLGCHRDEHRGQLSEACLSCHNYDAFKPAAAFNHQKAKFPLTGKHQQVLCDKCHPLLTDNKYADNVDYLKFSEIPHDSCIRCHQDIHKGKFGVNCQECHNTTGWKVISQAEFDHSRTDFPLEGKHATLLCVKCHKPGKTLSGLKYDKCTNCHQDYHQGQFAAHPTNGECNECHTVNGFIPSTFTIQKHQQSDFPLAGSHLAVPCIACHKISQTAGITQTIQFKFESTRCKACHDDRHAGEVDKYVQTSGCEYCHNVASWRRVSFDHGQTKFILEGKHETIECRDCHKPVKQNISDHSLSFVGLTASCQNCHRDIHQGQFANIDANQSQGENRTDCGRCHSPRNWSPDKFDHNQAAFKLDGAHKKLECIACHKRIMKDDREFTWFKPLDKSCEYCHGGKYTEENLGDS